MPSPLNPPDSPPAGPVIPEGLATQVGKVVGAAFTLIALVTAVLDGDHSQETITALILAAVTFVTLMAGRFAQAYAIYRDAPSPFSDEGGDEAPPEAADYTAPAVVPPDEGNPT